MIGKLLGNRYELLEKIGEGGMAEVYKAKCNILNRIVAVKILKNEFAEDEEFLMKFKNEAQAAASLNHPNIVNVYDVGQEGKVSYIVMEYIEGVNLKELIKKEGRMPEKRALKITKQIAMALSEAHSKKIIHRDIKPHNIIVTKDNLVKVADFGIAKAATSSTITTVGDAIGSVHYFSPEQARGGYMDERSDIYSLGIVLYELLLGTLPFNGDTPVNIALKHIHSRVEIPKEMEADISEGSKALILKMTQRSLDKRYSDVLSIVLDINNLEKDRPLNYEINEEEEFETKKILFGKDQIQNFKEDFEDDYDDYDEVQEVVKENKKLNKNKKNPVTRKRGKKSKSITIFAIVSALVASIAFLGAFFIFAGPDFLPLNLLSFRSNAIETSSFLGLTLEEAKEKAEEVGLEIEFMGEEENTRYAPGTVMRQEPREGVKVKEGHKVEIFISKQREEMVTVPSLTGGSLSEAVEALKALGLEEAVEYRYSEQAEDVVIEQRPSRGEEVSLGSQVRLTVSRGPEEILELVPNLLGKKLEEARSELGGFTLGDVSYNEDRDKPDGTVLSQNPRANTQARQGSEISLIINRIERVEEPATRNMRLTIVLPDKETVAIQIRDLSTGAIVYDQVVRPEELNGVLAVDLIGRVGESKVYEIFADSVSYAKQQVDF